ncbi:MAG: flagellar biosynthesis protein FlhB [Burkholderiales bacterium]
MSEESDLERTESATPKRLEEAREKGQVARSQELSTFVVLLAGAGGLVFMGGSLFERVSGVMKRGLQFRSGPASDPHLMVTALHELMGDALLGLLPLLALVLVAALAAPLLLSGWIFIPPKLDFQRLSPAHGLGRMFSLPGAAELFKALAKALVIGGIAAWVMWHNREALLSLTGNSIESGSAQMGSLLGSSILTVVCGMLLIAAIDVPYQLWSHYNKLKMTREEVRQEARESEGDPHLKARIRSIQREAARRRMMAEIPKADVIVTNPTHYAVALRYSSDTMRAPRVVAKGAHLLAQRIRELGEAHRVPIMEAPPLARALYHHTELGDEIPETLYTAVAELLAYIFQLRRYRESGGPLPVAPLDLPVPDGLDPEAGVK